MLHPNIATPDLRVLLMFSPVKNNFATDFLTDTADFGASLSWYPDLKIDLH